MVPMNLSRPGLGMAVNGLDPRLSVIGANHECAPIAVRERLAISKASLPGALQRLALSPAVEEAYILSTCNRTEIYLAGESPQAEESAALAFLTELSGFAREELTSHLYQKTGVNAIRHLFTVAAGANSMILGDTEILGQIKESFSTAAQTGTLGKTLHALIKRALEVGKSARTQTQIGGKAASLSYAAVELAAQQMDIKQARVLIVGAGKFGRLVAKILADKGARGIVFANRSFDKAETLAVEFRGTAIPLEQLVQCLPEIDLAVAATDAPCFILQREEIQHALQARTGEALVLIDLGTPRNIDESAQTLPGVALYNIDQLQTVIQNNLDTRREALQRVEEIVEARIDEFMAWYQAACQGDTIKSLIDAAEVVRQEELRKLERKFLRLTSRDRHTVDMLTSRIINRLLHQPITRLKDAAASGDGEELAEATRRLFHLEPLQ